MNKNISSIKFLICASILLCSNSKIVHAQTLQTITNNGGNNTTNPIAIGSNTTTPAALLEIYHNGSSTFGTALQIKTTGGNGDGPRAAFEINNNGAPKRWNLGIRQLATSFGIFEDGFSGGFGSERLTILAGGNVGIGENNPTSKLTIAAGEGDGIAIGRPNDPLGYHASGYSIKFYGYRDIISNVITSKITSERTNLCCMPDYPWLYQGSDLAFYTTDNINTPNADNSIERLRIKDNGNVGIGTSNPLAKLHVEGPGGGKVLMGSNNGTYGLMSLNGAFWDYNMLSSSVDRNLYFNRPAAASIYFGMGGTNDQMILNGSGNLGIGTLNPWERLTVMGSVASRDPNGGNIFLNGNDGGIEVSSGNDSYSFIDFKGNNNLNSDMQGRFSYADENGFDFATGADYTSKLRISLNGNVGIGTTNTPEKLCVNGNIKTRRLIVTQTGWPDYVFHSIYKLRSLSSLETYINQYKHLPDVPSAYEVEKDGLDLGATQAALLKKIEELTLYVIELNKKIEKLEAKK